MDITTIKMLVKLGGFIVEVDKDLQASWRKSAHHSRSQVRVNEVIKKIDSDNYLVGCTWDLEWDFPFWEAVLDLRDNKLYRYDHR